ncbi:hypothetical protein BH09ACT10_BH09ACT10_01070 [soil metagenome]
MTNLFAPEGGPEELICSSKGCQNPATHSILWNNPKIHTPERRKTWLACPDHEPTLRTFLSARDFYKETQPIG